MPPKTPGDVEVVYIPVDELHPFEGNPRKRAEKIFGHLRKSILEFGFVDPVIFWANAEEHGYPSKTVIGGHRRLDVYKSLIENREIEPAPVPCIPVVINSVAKAKALNLALNKISEEFDIPTLNDILVEIDTGEFDVEITGFDAIEIEDLVTYRDPNASEGEVPLTLTLKFESVGHRAKFYRLLDHYDPETEQFDKKFVKLTEVLYAEVFGAETA